MDDGAEEPGAADAAALAEAEGLIERARATLSSVEAVLEQLDAGSAGTCEVCGEPIAPDRLVRDPFARRCERHET